MFIDVEQWRNSIGIFNSKRISNSSLSKCNNDFLIFSEINSMCFNLSKILPIQLFCGMLILFAFCTTVLLTFPCLMLWYLFCYTICTAISPQCHFPFLIPFTEYSFLLIFQVPNLLSYSIKVLGHYLRLSFSIGIVNFAFYLIILQILLMVSGNIEKNPGPTQKIKTKLSFAVWNLDSLPAREYARIPLIETFQATYDFDLFGVCESSLNTSIPNEAIFISGFSPDPFRADKLPNTRNGGVCLYFREDLPIKRRTDLELLTETIVAEVNLKRKKTFIILSYCHPNLSSIEFEEYTCALEKIYLLVRREKPSVVILTGDFNARSPLFWENDTETREGRVFNNFLLSNNLEELINEPTHIRDDGAQSCIDLICTDHANLFTETGVFPTLDVHSKHNIVFGALNFHVPCPPPYKRKIWDYKSAKVQSIRKDLNETNWKNLFFNLNVNEMCLVFSDRLMEILSKHIPNKIITLNDKDAPWITPKLKTAIRRNTRVYRKWTKKGRNENDRENVRKCQNEVNKLIKNAKQSYYNKLGEKLCDPQIGAKSFWNAFKRISNRTRQPNIPPIIVNDNHISNFKAKANIFNDYFADQCKILNNDSTLPEIAYKTTASTDHVDIPINKIINIINKMNPKKGGGHDGISISMLQLCVSEVALPLQIIFQKCILTGKFPDHWKYANVQPVHKKSNRQIISNYRPISLLPICSKVLEKIVFDHVYSYLNNNKLLSKNQSGFRPGDSTIYQLISITTNIYESFEKYDETRAVFLDISKAFDKVWHKGIIHKLKCNGVSGNLLNFFENYLQNRKQRVVLNGIESNWENVSAGVPQGSVLGPLLFIIYINDLTDNISSDMRLFADDSSLFTRVSGIEETHEKLVNDLETVTAWGYQWKMEFNPNINKQAIEVIFSAKQNKPIHPNIALNDIPVARKEFTKHIGMYLDNYLNFNKHIKEAILTAQKGLSLLKYLSKYVSRDVLNLSYKLYVRPHLDYGDVIYHNQRKDLMKLLEQVQYKAAIIVSGCWQGTNRSKLYDELGWESLTDRRWARRMSTFYKIKKGIAPAYLSDHLPADNIIDISLRDRKSRAPFCRTERYENSFFPYCIKNWNTLDDSVKSLPSLLSFKNHLNNFIRPKSNSTFDIRDKFGIKLLTKIRVEFSDLRDHRFNHNFNCLSPTCLCGIEDETSVHFYLCCSRYLTQRAILLSNLSDIIASDVSVLPNEHLIHIILYGSNVYNKICNKLILEQSILYIKNTKRFDKLEAFL